MVDSTTLKFGALAAAAFTAGVARGASHKHGLPHLPLEGLLVFGGSAFVGTKFGSRILSDEKYGVLNFVGGAGGAAVIYIAEETGQFFGYLLG